MSNLSHRHSQVMIPFMMCIIIGSLVTGCSLISPERATETRNETYDTKTSPKLLRVIAVDGAIDVQEDTAVQGISVSAKIVAGGKTVQEAQDRLKETKIEIIEPSTGEVSIKAIWPKPASQADSVSFTIRLPELQEFNGRSSNGRITVDGASGPSTIETSNGDVSVTGSQKSLDINTSNGDVDIRDHIGDIAIDTSNGNVDIANLMGGASVETSNSRVTVQLNNESTKPVKLRTSNDDINLTCGTAWNGVISADTSNDDIIVEGTQGRIKSQSIKDARGSITIGSGGDTSRLTTSNGDIRITVR